MIQKLTASLLASAALLVFSFAVRAQEPALTRHVHEPVRSGVAKAVGHISADQILQLNIVLPVADRAGLDSFVKEVSDPFSPIFRQFLTPQEFTARFGPTQADYAALVQFLQTNGFEIVGGSRDGMNVQAKGPISAIENAFHVRMQTYRHPYEKRTFYSPDREPTTDLPFPLWHISGLDNFSAPHPLFKTKTAYAAEHGISVNEVVNHATTGSGPSGSFLGSDMRAAYYGGTALTGAGQNLGLFEYVGTDLADLKTYFANVHETNKVPVTVLSTDGTSTSCTKGCDDTEQLWT